MGQRVQKYSTAEDSSEEHIKLNAPPIKTTHCIQTTFGHHIQRNDLYREDIPTPADVARIAKSLSKSQLGGSIQFGRFVTCLLHLHTNLNDELPLGRGVIVPQDSKVLRQLCEMASWKFNHHSIL